MTLPQSAGRGAPARTATAIAPTSAVGRGRTVPHHRRAPYHKVLPGALRRVPQVASGPPARNPGRTSANLALWTYVLGGRRTPRRVARHPPGLARGGRRDRGAHRPQRLPHQHDYARLHLGLERRGGQLRHAAAGGERASSPIRATSRRRSRTCTTCWAGTRSRSLGDPGGAEPVPASASPAQRRGQQPEPWPGLLSAVRTAARRIRRCSKLPAGDCRPRRCIWTTRRLTPANEVAINWNAPLVFLLGAPEKCGALYFALHRRGRRCGTRRRVRYDERPAAPWGLTAGRGSALARRSTAGGVGTAAPCPYTCVDRSVDAARAGACATTARTQ